jgi:antagonist of KipI
MSIEIIKPGLLSTLVDSGRSGYREFGIGPSGAMDRFAMTVSNCLVGNKEELATLEMHFPAPEIMFHQTHLVCVSGIGFEIKVDDKSIPLWKPFLAKKGSRMKFTKVTAGSRVYFSTQSGWRAEKWLESFTTHLGVQAGGHEGRVLKKGDIIETNKTAYYKDETKTLPWGISLYELSKIYLPPNEIRIIKSIETGLLSVESNKKLLSSSFTITRQSNRMGYRLEGEKLFLNEPVHLVSSAVNFGTIQLLPDGNLIVLMADHQTTGGYPRIAAVIKSDLPKLAQLNPDDKINFKLISLIDAENELRSRERLLDDLKQACLANYEKYFCL